VMLFVKGEYRAAINKLQAVQVGAGGRMEGHQGVIIGFCAIPCIVVARVTQVGWT
jgi:hypothetical protein